MKQFKSKCCKECHKYWKGFVAIISKFHFLLVLNSCVQNVHEHRTSVYQDRFDYFRPLSKSLVELTMIVSDSIDSLYRCCLELMI